MIRLGNPVVVTGANSGIGYAISTFLCANGVHVFAGHRTPCDGERLKAELGDLATPIPLDITIADSVESAAEMIRSLSPGGLSGLVNNAGVAVAGPLECLPIESLQRELEVNVVSAVRTTQAFLPMLRQGGGRIVNIGSASGSFALPFLGPYAASKFAMEAISDSMRRELRTFGIRVILIRPGRMATDIFRRAEVNAIAMVDHLPESQNARYRPVLEKFQSLMHASANKGRDPEQVAKVVSKALSTRRPRARYNVGMDAHLVDFLSKISPDWLSDWGISRIIRP